MSDIKYSYSKIHRVLEISGIVTFIYYMGLLGYKLLNQSYVFNPNNEFSFYIQLFLVLSISIAAADFVSGFVHFLGDTYGEETTPILGQSFIKPFREHHVDPKGITRHDFIETNGNNCIISIPAIIAIYYLVPVNESVDKFTFVLFFFFLMLGIFLTNQIHKWAHEEKNNILITKLQDWNLILPPVHHEVHHTKPYDKFFCITTGWLNPFLDQIKFFEIIKKLTGK